MAKKEYVWKSRTPEWIKANPKQGTMYKEYTDENGNITEDPMVKHVKMEQMIPNVSKKPIKAEKPKRPPTARAIERKKEAEEKSHQNWIARSLRNKEESEKRREINQEKKAIRRENKPIITKHAGVYLIICGIEKHAYVGQSVNMDVRLRSHKMAISSKNNVAEPSHGKMKAHYVEHGTDAFEFIKYIPLINPTQEDLLNKEAEIMTEFIKKGYTLYNRSITIKASNQLIYCPTEYQTLISNIIRLLDKDSDMLATMIKSFGQARSD